MEYPEEMDLTVGDLFSKIHLIAFYYPYKIFQVYYWLDNVSYHVNTKK